MNLENSNADLPVLEELVMENSNSNSEYDIGCFEFMRQLTISSLFIWYDLI